MKVNFLELIGWTWHYARRFPREVAAVLACMAANVALSVVKPWPIVFLVDYVLRAHPMPDWLAPVVRSLPGSASALGLAMWSVATTVLIFILQWLCTLGADYANVSLGQRVTYEVATDLFRHLQQLSLSFHTRRSTGDIVRRVASDCAAIGIILRSALLPVLASIATLCVMVAIMLQLSTSLTIVAALVAPGMALVFHLHSRKMLERSYREQEAEAKIYELAEQTFSAITAVQAFGREALNELALRDAHERTTRAALSSLRVQLRFKILMGFATALGTAAILLTGGRAVLAGEMSVGTILLFLSYLASLYSPLEAIMYTGSTIQTAGGSARRVFDILRTEPEVRDGPHARQLAQVRGEVRFENVTFGYEAGRPILRDISLTVAPGETVALVGPTGAGKSTLVSLIPRFFDPNDGCLRVDGMDVRNVQLASLRRQVALVLQEPFLFPLSVAENIAYGRPGASLAQIQSAARAANAHDFIGRLPQGYDTVLDERGANLSGGERQRLSIARALLKNAPILILDEPTSALDVETEAAIMDALQTLVRDRTTFIIAHRLATVQRADRIIVLQKGAITESGTHAELVSRNGTYARYAARQFGARAPRAVAP